MLTAVTDRNGHWGNQTYADWTETETGSKTVDQLTPVMVHPRGNVTDGAVPTDTNMDLTVLFEDPYVPTLVVLNPEGDVVQNTTGLRIDGRCSDPHSGVGLVQFSFDPNPDWDLKIWSDATGTTDWFVDTLQMPEGLHTLYVRAFDTASLGTDLYAGQRVGQVVIDLSPPIVQVTSPDVRRQPVIVNTSTFQLEGWVSEAVSSIHVQRTAVPMVGSTFSVEAFVSEGLNDVTIVATDLAGNTGTYTFSVLRDTVAPTITLTAPAEGALLNATSVRVAGLVDEQVQDNTIVMNGAPVTLSSGAFQFLLNGFDDGPGTIDVTAVDMAGNTVSVSVNVIIDTLPPEVKLVSPIDGLLTRHGTVLLEGTSEAGAHITVQGTSVVMTGNTFAHTLDLAEGRNIIHVTSTDEAGNVNSTLVVVDRDSTPPVLELYGLTDGGIDSENERAVINGRTEAGAILWMSIEGVSEEVITFPDGSFIQPLTVGLEETQVTIRAEDAAGNTAFAEVTIYLKKVKDPTTAPSEPEPVDPVITAAVVTTTTIVLVGVAMTFEFTKYALVLMVLPLYARIKKHEVLDNKTRLAIHGLVVENPGMHYNEIIREFDLTNGVAAYHLDVLEREGFVRSVRDGTLRRFYSSSTKVPGGHKATPDQTREQILEMIIANPGINQKSIVDELGIGRTLVGYHLKTLIDEGYIEAHKQGRFTVYSRTRKRWFRLN
jgi:DNA-binding MarR family transcriptional regulator